MPVLVAAILIVVVGTAALIVQRRRHADPPTQPVYAAPAQLDRADFDATNEWLVVTFTSASCSTCADVKRKAAVLASAEVGVVDVEYSAAGAVHARYNIDAVPTLVIADRDGVVRGSFLGPVSATDLWAAVARARDPESVPEHGCGSAD
ncbi:MAG TPA: thioredoxin family protein [Ilumatobacteraceae bacterium]|nr:thioredoxin family protein [Ilumatobacteraceae bacterium]